MRSWCVKRRIAIDCLNCGHCASIAEADLVTFGLEENASLVVLTKRLVCKECGSKAVRSFRFEDDEDQRDMLHESPPLVPKSR